MIGRTQKFRIYLMMFYFSKKYFLLGVLLFVIEVLIALYLDDNFIRPYVGDFLVVILLYCMLKSTIRISAWKAALGVLLFSYAIESMQYFNVVSLLGLQHNKLARIIIGTYFTWDDMAAYTLGILLVLMLERKNVIKKGK